MGNQNAPAKLTQSLAARHPLIIRQRLRLDSALPVSEWCEAVEEAVGLWPEANAVGMGSWRALQPGEWLAVIMRDKVLRVS